MKKLLALTLALMMICCASLAMAEIEAITVDITFDGTYIPFEDYNFQVFLPNEWIVYEPGEGIYYAVGNEDGTQQMTIEIFESEGYTMDDILAELTATEGYEGVTALTVNEIPFVIYDFPANNMFGATTLSVDGTNMFFFKFVPNDDEAFGELAKQIMASVAVIQE